MIDKTEIMNFSVSASAFRSIGFNVKSPHSFFPPPLMLLLQVKKWKTPRASLTAVSRQPPLLLPSPAHASPPAPDRSGKITIGCFCQIDTVTKPSIKLLTALRCFLQRKGPHPHAPHIHTHTHTQTLKISHQPF